MCFFSFIVPRPKLPTMESHTTTVTEDPKIKNEINSLKNQIDLMNEELMEYKKQSYAHDMLGSSLFRRRDDAVFSVSRRTFRKTNLKKAPNFPYSSIAINRFVC